MQVVSCSRGPSVWPQPFLPTARSPLCSPTRWSKATWLLNIWAHAYAWRGKKNNNNKNGPPLTPISRTVPTVEADSEDLQADIKQINHEWQSGGVGGGGVRNHTGAQTDSDLHVSRPGYELWDSDHSNDPVSLLDVHTSKRTILKNNIFYF